MPWGFLLFQASKVLEFGKGINRLIYLGKRCDMFTFILWAFNFKNVGKRHFSRFRNVIYHFWLHELKCSKSFLQFLFVLNSCWVHSSNLEERAPKLSSKSLLGNSEVSDVWFLFYLPFPFISSVTLAGCFSWADVLANIPHTHMHMNVHTHTFSLNESINLVICHLGPLLLPAMVDTLSHVHRIVSLLLTSFHYTLTWLSIFDHEALALFSTKISPFL